MDALFGVPTTTIARVLAVLTVALVIAVLLPVLRRRSLLRMGARNALRRPLRSAVIVAGLMLSTLVVSAAFSTGDAMSLTVRSLVAGSVGTVDETISAARLDPTQLSNRSIDSLTSGGGLPQLAAPYFPQDEYDQIAAGTRGSKAIAGLLPEISEQAPVAGGPSPLPHPNVGIIGLPGDLGRGFQPLRDTSGAARSTDELAANEVYLNQAAASLLGSAAGQNITVFLGAAAGTGGASNAGAQPQQFSVRAVLQNGAVAGPTPAVFFGLARLQTLRDEPGQINQISVVNRCSLSQACSAQAALDIRKVTVDPQAAETVREALDSSDGRSAMNALINRRSGTGRAQIVDLKHTVSAGHLTDHLIYLLGDPQIAGTLRAAASGLPGRGGRLGRTLFRMNSVTVVEVKEGALQDANQYASLLTSSFLVLGLFSIAASLLLVFLVFVLLAAERRGEMGIARAIGLQRSHLVQTFAVEGLLYAIAAAALGVVAGIAASIVIVRLVAHALAQYGVPVQQSLTARSPLIAFCAGLSVTLLTVLLAAWRVSRVNIVEAIRGVPAEATRGRGIRAAVRAARIDAAAGSRSALAGAASLLAGVAASVGALLANGVLPAALGAVLLLAGGESGSYLATGFGWSLLAIGLGLLLRLVLLTRGWAGGRAERLAFSLAALAATAYWLLPPGTYQSGRHHLTLGRVEEFAVAGVFMVIGVVALVAYNLTEPLRVALKMVRRGGAVTAALRMAAAYPLLHRFRTGMAVAMFALVVFTMVVSAVLLESAHQAYARRERPPTGYDITASVPASATLPDLPAALQSAPAVKPVDFSGAGSESQFSAQVIEPAGVTARWNSATVHLADLGLLRGTPLRLSARAAGYGSDASVWNALATRPGMAVVARDSVQRAGGGSFSATVTAFNDSQSGFAPDAVWLRDGDGRSLKLTVIGVVDDSTALPSGLLTLKSNVVTPSAVSAKPDLLLFQTAPGEDVNTAALGIDLSFGLQGVQTQIVGQTLVTVQTVRQLLNYLLEGFVGLGLLSGVAALGVVSARAVVERRQEIGMLRAIGLLRWHVELSFLIESALVALLGIGAGVALGLLLARDVVVFLAQRFRELQVAVPWGEVALIAAAAFFAALVPTGIAAWRAGRVDPAEALRYE